MTELMPIDSEKLEEYNQRRDKVKFKSLKPEKQKPTTKKGSAGSKSKNAENDKPKEAERSLYTRFVSALIYSIEREDPNDGHVLVGRNPTV